MVMKTYVKSIVRTAKKNLSRFVSIIVIMMLGIAFVAGLGTVSPTFKDSFSAQMDADNFPDIVIKCKLTSGFSEETLAQISGLSYVEDVSTMSSIDFRDGEERVRLYVYDDLQTSVAKLGIDGELPKNKNEILVERASNVIGRYELNDIIKLFGMPIQYKVVGIASNPMIYDLDGEPFIDTETEEADGELDKIVYMQRDLTVLNFFPTTDVQILLKDMGARDFFSKTYEKDVNAYLGALKEVLGEEDYAYLTVKENKSSALLASYCDKVSIITLIFPVFFIAVSALVVMTTVTRMVEEERALIGCLRSLGVGDVKISLQYLLLSAICCVVASLGGMLGGLVLPNVIYPAFATLFFLPAMSKNFYVLSGVLALSATSLVVLLVTYFVCRDTLKEKPSELFTAKAPVVGKAIFLEKIPAIWDKFSFKYKSSIRNIFRYKKHLIMTVLSVAGSTALVFAGFALLDVASAMGKQGGSYAQMMGSISMIAFVVVVFALLLCVFVVYNLTNLNVGERKKELATLGVLGYQAEEMMGYIYREILMMAFVGAIVGLGMGMALIWTALEYLEFGSLWDAQWHAYVSSVALVLLFVLITDVILAPKILKIDMTSALKVND